MSVNLMNHAFFLFSSMFRGVALYPVKPRQEDITAPQAHGKGKSTLPTGPVVPTG